MRCVSSGWSLVEEKKILYKLVKMLFFYSSDDGEGNPAWRERGDRGSSLVELMCIINLGLHIYWLCYSNRTCRDRVDSRGVQTGIINRQ